MQYDIDFEVQLHLVYCFLGKIPVSSQRSYSIEWKAHIVSQHLVVQNFDARFLVPAYLV